MPDNTSRKTDGETFEVEGYKTISLVGRGSVGRVFVAEDGEGNRGALKIMQITPFYDPEILEEIVEGAMMTKKISPEANVVKIHSSGRKEDFYYIIMDLISGSTLRDYIDGGAGSRNLEFSVKTALELAETLSFVHEAGIIHGDLKPSNILLDRQNIPYLSDFYLALYNIRLSRKKNSMTLPLGTPLYMSPEQAAGQFITPASDAYSFGVIFYEMLTGRLPYGENPANIAGMVKIIENSPVLPPSDYNGEIGSRLEKILLKLLEKDTDRRYSDFSAVASDISSLKIIKKTKQPGKQGMLAGIFKFLGLK